MQAATEMIASLLLMNLRVKPTMMHIMLTTMTTQILMDPKEC